MELHLISRALPIFILISVTLTCSPPEGDAPELTMAQSAHYANIILLGKVQKTYSDAANSYGGDVYTATMKVYCIYKGEATARMVNISMVGEVPGLCHTTHLEEGREYIVFLDSEHRISDVEIANTEKNRMNVSRACGLHLKYPTGLSAEDLSVQCPKPATSGNCVPHPDEAEDHDHEGHDHSHGDHDHEGHDHGPGHDHTHDEHDHEGHDHSHDNHKDEGEAHDHEGHDHSEDTHDHEGHEHGEGHDHSHDEHNHEGHDHSHDDHSHDDHDHEGHDHSQDDHDHEGHDHGEGHDHSNDKHDHKGHDHSHDEHSQDNHDHDGHDHSKDSHDHEGHDHGEGHDHSHDDHDHEGHDHSHDDQTMHGDHHGPGQGDTEDDPESDAHSGGAVIYPMVALLVLAVGHVMQQ